MILLRELVGERLICQKGLVAIVLNNIFRRVFKKTYWKIVGRSFKDGWDACEQTIVRQHRGQHVIDRVELYTDDTGTYKLGVVEEKKHVKSNK